MPRTYKKASTILEKAAEELKWEEKWVQGAFLCAKGKKCAIGAVAYFSGDLSPLPNFKDQLEMGKKYEEDVFETVRVVNDPSDGFKEAVKFLNLALNPDIVKEWDEMQVDIDLVDWNEHMDQIIQYNDDDFGSEDSKSKIRKEVVKAMKKAAKAAKKVNK